MALISYRTTQSMIDCFRAFSVLDGMEAQYPDFREWYVNKVVPDVVSRDGVMVIAEQDDQIVGMGIGRRGEDPKFRCLRVVDRLAHRGVGIRLMDRVLKGMGIDHPLTTVSEPMLHDLSRIFVNRFGFNLVSVEKGLYRPGVLEYVYNQRMNHKVRTAY